MPGTPVGLVVAGALGPFQSARLVWPLTSVPAVVRSSRQATLMVSAPLTFTLSTRAQWPAAGLSAAADLALARAGEVARAQGATVSAALLIDGEPAQALVKAAEDRSADLIVMGAVHDRSLAGRLLGTTAEEVTKKATCDVLIVRPVDPVDELEVPEEVSPS